MKNQLTILALLLSVTAYAGKEKKTAKQKQSEPVKEQQVDTATKGKANSYWEQDPRLGRHLHVEPTKETK